MRSKMCSLHLTHPSGAVGSRHCGTRRAVGGSVPCSRVSPQSWTPPARSGIRTHNLELPWVSSPTLYPLGARTHTHTHIHTQTLSLTYTHTHTHCLMRVLTWPLTLSDTHSHTHTRTHTHSLSHTYTHTHTHTHCLMRVLTWPLTLSDTHLHTHTHTHTHTVWWEF